MCHHQQGPTGSFFEYWGGFGSCNEKSHVAGAFLSGKNVDRSQPLFYFIPHSQAGSTSKNVEIFNRVFPSTLSSLGYFWHYLYFGRSEPNELES